MARCLPQPSEAAMAGRLLRGRGPSGFLRVRRFGWKKHMCLGPRREENFEAGRRQRRPQGRPPRPQGLLIDDRQMQFARFLLASRLLGACALASCWGRGPLLLLEGFLGVTGRPLLLGASSSSWGTAGFLQGALQGIAGSSQGRRMVSAWRILHGLRLGAFARSFARHGAARRDRRRRSGSSRSTE